MARDIGYPDYIEYIPKWDGQDKEENPIKIKIKILSYNDILKYGSENENLDKYNVAKKMFCESVISIENLKFNGKEIKKGEDLWKLGKQGLIEEVNKQIFKESSLSEIEKKT